MATHRTHYHVCLGSDGNRKVSEIWNSREPVEALPGERLMPILASGIQFANPGHLEVHNIVEGLTIGRGGANRESSRRVRAVMQARSSWEVA